MAKEPTLKLTVSAATYNEIAAALEQSGHKLDINVGTLTLERGTKLEQPVDYRMATIRKDAGLIASRAFNPSDMPISFVDFIDEIYQYIITGAKKEVQIASTSEWK